MAPDFDAVIDRRGTGSSKWSRYAPDVLPMWVADMDFAVAPEIIAALRERLDHPVLGYAVAQDALRQRIVAMLAEEYGWAVQPDALLFLPGVEPGFNMALKALLEPGQGVLVQTPMYRPILAAPAHWGLRRIDLPLHPSAALDRDAFRAAIAGAGAFLLCNPHNPLGRVFTRAELAGMAEDCLAAEAWIIADEIHCDLLFDGRRHVPIAALDPAIAARTITLMSASKTYNIAGMKCAFAIVPDAALRARYLAAKSGMVDSVNALGLEATLAAYTHAGAWKQALLAYLQGNRDWLMQAVATRLPGLTMHLPDATFLAWLDCSARDFGGAEPQAWLLDHAKVGLSAGHEFGAGYASFARLNFGCPRDVLEAGIARLQASLA